MKYTIDWKTISKYINDITDLFKGNYNSTSVIQNKILYLYIREPINVINSQSYIDLFKTMNDYLYDESDIRQELRMYVLELHKKYRPRKLGRHNKVKYKNTKISLNGYIFTMLGYLAKRWMDTNIRYLHSPIGINKECDDTFNLNDLLTFADTHKNAFVWSFSYHFLDMNSKLIGDKFNINSASIRRKISKMKKEINK